MMKLSIGTYYTDEYYIKEILNKNESATNRFYSSCKSYCMGSFKKMFSDKDAADEFFQNSFVKLWKEIDRQSIFLQDNQIYKVGSTGDAKPLTCNLRTYLMGIVKNDHSQYLKKNEKELLCDDLAHITQEEVEPMDKATYEDGLKAKIVAECVEKMPEACYKILTLFYYEKKTLDEIMLLLGNYTSKDGLKTRKHKCMGTLKSRIEDRFAMYNLKPYCHERGNTR